MAGLVKIIVRHVIAPTVIAAIILTEHAHWYYRCVIAFGEIQPSYPRNHSVRSSD